LEEIHNRRRHFRKLRGQMERKEHGGPANGPTGPSMPSLFWAPTYMSAALHAVAGLLTDNIAKWNGSSWSLLGSELDRRLQSSVQALAVAGTNYT